MTGDEVWVKTSTDTDGNTEVRAVFTNRESMDKDIAQYHGFRGRIDTRWGQWIQFVAREDDLHSDVITYTCHEVQEGIDVDDTLPELLPKKEEIRIVKDD